MEKYRKTTDRDFSFAVCTPTLDEQFMRLVNADDADDIVDELASAIAWVMENIPRASLAAGNSSVLSAGSLSALNLPAAAVSTIDTGRISFSCRTTLR